jgi:hypothetical protein
MVEQSDLPAKLTLTQLNIPKSTFYNWYGRYLENGFADVKHPLVLLMIIRREIIQPKAYCT